MIDYPLTIHSWPKAILHVDADAFFASCEQATKPYLRGKPVVTGKERGIVAAASYEAKALGVKRGMTIAEVKRKYPEVVILPSDYETYSIFSLRMFEILRRFSPDVEEYSIDEAFVDLTGLRRLYRCSYGEIGGRIKETIEKELKISVSIGISLTKVLSKIASKHQKPGGLTVIPGKEIHLYLEELPIEKVWGIGSNTSALLNKIGIKTALQFARKSEDFLRRYLSKPYIEIWHELNGRSIFPVNTEPKTSYKSISKAKTFTPPTSDEGFILSQLSRNLENACMKARRYSLVAKRLIIILTQHNFKRVGVEIELSRATAFPFEILPFAKEGFKRIYEKDKFYRQTCVVLSELSSKNELQLSLFDDTIKIHKMNKIYNAIDTLSKKYGKYTVYHGSSHLVRIQHEGERGDIPERRINLLKGETERKRIRIPIWNIKV